MYYINQNAYKEHGHKYAVYDSNNGLAIIKTNSLSEAVSSAKRMNNCLVAQAQLIKAASRDSTVTRQY
jgi:hypothetical protein